MVLELGAAVHHGECEGNGGVPHPDNKVEYCDTIHKTSWLNRSSGHEKCFNKSNVTISLSIFFPLDEHYSMSHKTTWDKRELSSFTGSNSSNTTVELIERMSQPGPGAQPKSRWPSLAGRHIAAVGKTILHTSAIRHHRRLA